MEKSLTFVVAFAVAFMSGLIPTQASAQSRVADWVAHMPLYPGVPQHDANRDGYPDHIYYDVSRDGRIDAAWRDDNQDGRYDAVMLDPDGDGVLNEVFFDADGSGDLEAYMFFGRNGTVDYFGAFDASIGNYRLVSVKGDPNVVTIYGYPLGTPEALAFYSTVGGQLHSRLMSQSNPHLQRACENSVNGC